METEKCLFSCCRRRIKGGFSKPFCHSSQTLHIVAVWHKLFWFRKVWRRKPILTKLSTFSWQLKNSKISVAKVGIFGTYKITPPPEKIWPCHTSVQCGGTHTLSLDLWAGNQRLLLSHHGNGWRRLKGFNRGIEDVSLPINEKKECIGSSATWSRVVL